MLEMEKMGGGVDTDIITSDVEMLKKSTLEIIGSSIHSVQYFSDS